MREFQIFRKFVSDSRRNWPKTSLKLKRQLQACLVRFDQGGEKPPGMMGGVMFFLLRIAFWLGLVCVLLPGNDATPSKANVDTAGAVSAATAAVSDMAGF